MIRNPDFREFCGENPAPPAEAAPPARPAPPDPVNKPRHYTSHPSGVECIDIVEHYGFRLGNAIKYIWRAGLKGGALEDLRKARWYLDREIAVREIEEGGARG